MRELLERWGTELSEDEAVAHFDFCRLDRGAGYLLVTSARVAFFAGRGGSRMIDWPRDGVSAVEERGRLLGRRLRVSGPGREVTLGRLRFAARLRRGGRGPALESVELGWPRAVESTT